MLCLAYTPSSIGLTLLDMILIGPKCLYVLIRNDYPKLENLVEIRGFLYLY